jgi:peptidyl-prolyl cis-trans isomerase C
MLKHGKFVTLAILGALTIGSAFAEDKSVVLVNGASIPQSRIDLRVQAAAMQGQADTTELRKLIREDMINLEVLSQKATKDGLDKKPNIVQQLEIARQSVLVSAFAQHHIDKNPLSDKKLRQEYNNVTADLGDKEYNARHILVETEKEAKAIIAKLNKKGDFSKLAEQNSADAGSAEHGGALGWSIPSNFVPPFANALLNLTKGKYTKKPIETAFGWHIIMMDDVRALKTPTYEELKPQLEQRLQQQMMQQVISNLRDKARIE